MHSVPGPAPSLTIATSGQLLKPQVPGNSLQPYKQQQAHRRQHACLLKEKHNSFRDVQTSKFTRVLKSGAHIRASHKGDAKQPPRSIPVTSRLTGAAFHAAALRGNLIHFLIRHQLPPLQCSQMGEIYCLLHPKTQPWEAHPDFTRKNEHYCQGGLLFSTKFARGKPGAGSKSLVLVKAAPVRARRWAGSCQCCLVVCTELSQDSPQQLKPPETQAGGGRAVTLSHWGQCLQHRAPGNGAGLEGVKLSPCWLSTAEEGCRDQLPRCLQGGSKPPPSGGFVLSGFYRNEKGAHDAYAQHW